MNEDFRIVESQFGEFSIERLNNHTPRAWVPCGDLRNPIPTFAGTLGYMFLEANRYIYPSRELAVAALQNLNIKREWKVSY